MDEGLASTPLRVLMISRRGLPYLAGAEVQAVGLARSLIALGVEVQLVTMRFTGGLASRETIDGVPVRRLTGLRDREDSSANGSGLRFYAVRASELLSAAIHVAAHGRAFDVVHAHCLSATSVGAIATAQAIGVPVIILPCLGGAGGDLRKMLHGPAGRLVSRLLRRVDRFAVLDQTIADDLIAIGVAPEQLAFVKNGVDLTRFRPASTAEREELRARLGLPAGPLALFVGQLIERKGVKHLLEAWRTVTPSVKDATLLFVGGGPDAARVEREAAAPGSRVRVLGVRTDVPELMRAANVLVLPSHNESFGNVIIEAMASGIPVIVGRTGVARSLAIDGRAGCVVDAAQPAEIACALRDIFSSPSRGAALGARGRTLVQPYDFRQVAGEYLALYESMIAAKGSWSPAQGREGGGNGH